MTTKTCPKCKQSKDLSEFHKSKTTKDGHQCYCKECILLHRKINKERNTQYNNEWLKNNKHHRDRYLSEYRNKNKQRISQYIKTWREKNEYFKIVDRNYQHKRRMLKSNTDITSTKLQQLINQTTHCYWCKLKLNGTFHIDHYMPLSKGGTHTMDNIVIACPSCNLKKSAHNPHDYAQKIGRLL